MSKENQETQRGEFSLSQFNPEPIANRLIAKADKSDSTEGPVDIVRLGLISLDNRKETLAPTILALIQGLGSNDGPSLQHTHSQLDGYLHRIQYHDPSYIYTGFDQALHIEYAESRRNYGYFLLFEDNRQKAEKLLKEHKSKLEASKVSDGQVEKVDDMDKKAKTVKSIKDILRKEKSLNEIIVNYDMHFLGKRVDRFENGQASTIQDAKQNDAYFRINPDEENKRAVRASKLITLTDDIGSMTPRETSRILISLLSFDELKKVEEIRSKYDSNMDRAGQMIRFKSYKDPLFRQLVKDSLDGDNLFPSDYLLQADNIAQEMVEAIAGATFIQLPSRTKREISGDTHDPRLSTQQKLFSHLTEAAYHIITSESHKITNSK